MAQYRTDLQDIYFNLFHILKIQDQGPEFDESELKEVIKEFDKFVEHEFYPTRQIGDSKGVTYSEGGVVTVPDCFKKVKDAFYENGWFGLGMPEDIGGMVVPESIYFACNSLSIGANTALMMYPGLSKAALNLIHRVGTAEQKQYMVPNMMSGLWGGTMCLTEPGAGSDVGAASTKAKPQGDGSYLINGVKIFISSGENDLYENIIHLVLARTPNAPEGVKGLSLFIVPKFLIKPDGTCGDRNDVFCTKVEEKMGIHGNATCELTFGQKDNCIGHLIGKEFDGIKNMFLMMNEARLLCAIQGESQANLAFQLSLQYAKERSQFGKILIDLPDVKRILLKMRAVTRGMRSLILYTGNLFDLEKKDPAVESLIALLTPVCKSYCTDRGFEMCNDAIQVHGGYGYCHEYGVEQFARDSRIAMIYEGTNGIQAIDFVMRKILKDNGEAFRQLAGRITKTLSDPSAGNWPSEIGMIGKMLQQGQSILEKFGKLAKMEKFDGILECTTDFLKFSGNIIVAWLLLRGAITAKKELGTAPEADKFYLNSKMVDFETFSQYVLMENYSLSKTILDYDNRLEKLEL